VDHEGWGRHRAGPPLSERRYPWTTQAVAARSTHDI
jgi:hypothetical protein